MTDITTRPEVVVYRVVDTDTRECSLGYRHTVEVYAEKHLRFTGRYRDNPHTDSYGDTLARNPIYVDRQGREYQTSMAVDYYSTTQYLDPDGHTWTGRKPPPPAQRFDQIKEAS